MQIGQSSLGDRPLSTSNLALSCFEAVTKLFGKRPLIVQPVCVLSLGRYNPEKNEFSEEWVDLFGSAQARVDRMLDAPFPVLRGKARGQV